MRTNTVRPYNKTRSNPLYVQNRYSQTKQQEGTPMKIAIITEGSTKNRNADVVKAITDLGHEAVNLGMKNIDGEPDLTYMETALLAALALNLQAADFVIGGCGTGQGFMNAVLQYPGVSCGLLCDPVDAFLFARVNAGNCVSLALNKGYGNLGGDINVRYILEKLFIDDYGAGYPEARAQIQIGARKKLAQLSLDTHKSIIGILQTLDRDFVRYALAFPGVRAFMLSAPESELKDLVLRQ